jgi:hypothetical protein
MNEQATHLRAEALLNSILTGPLLMGDLPEAKSFCRSDLRWPANPPLLNFQQKLGHLFEDAVASLLEASDRMELLEQNLQLRDEDLKTVGELDFLLKDQAAPKLIHLELATKFYLAVQTPNGVALPGPDARDNYFRKLSRMRDHQLQLPTKYHSCLPPEYKDRHIDTQQLIYGCLFDHFDALETCMPEFVLPTCRRGKWLHQPDYSRYFSPKTKFEIIPKALWPVPFEILDGIAFEPWNPNKPIDRCLMVRVDNELPPFFIAPAGYPTQS